MTTPEPPLRAPDQASPPADHADKARTALQRIADLRAWLFLAFLILAFELWSRVSFGGTFLFNPFNIQSIAIFAVAPLLLATGQTFVIISGGIDLSMGFIMGLAAVVAAHVINWATPGMGLPMAVLFGALVAIAVAAVPGVVNGLLVSRLKVPPFIGTLGMFGVARGVAFLLAGGTTVPVQNSFFAALGNGRFYGVPWIVIITAVFVLVMHYLLSQTRFGQHNYAIGANVQAASRAGMTKQGLALTLPRAAGSEGKGRRRRKAKRRSSSAVTSFTARCSTWPKVSRIAQRRMEATASSARTGSPSWKSSPSRSVIVQVRPSALTSWPRTICGRGRSARSTP